MTTKPFEDIVSCQINGERSSIRLHSTLENLKEFIRRENDLEISLCSDERLIANCYMSWKSLLEQWKKNGIFNEENPIIVDHLLKFETTAPLLSRPSSPVVDVNMSPVIGVQIGLVKEYEQTILTVNNEITERKSVEFEQVADNELSSRKSPVNDAASSTFTCQPQVMVHNVVSKSDTMFDKVSSNSPVYISEEIQLKAVYELQKWKEAREQEFEQEVTILNLNYLYKMN